MPVYLTDLNEIGHALSAEPDGVASARAARWYALCGRTPFGALLRADTAAFLRTRGVWVRPVLVLAVLVVVLLAAGAQPPLVQLGMIAEGCFFGGSGAGCGGQQCCVRC